MNEPPCAQVRELVPEIAAAAAAGDERAFALRHLWSCPDCRTELARTTEVVDELLTLAPAREPPPGFEAAALRKMLPSRHRFRPGGLAVVAAALAVAAACGAGAAWWRTADDRELAASHRDTLRTAHGTAFAAAPLLAAGGAEIATLFAYEGDPSWFYLTFRQLPEPGRYDARLRLLDGNTVQLRTLEVTPESFGWGSRASFRIRDLDAVEFSRSGSVAMSARFDLG